MLGIVAGSTIRLDNIRTKLRGPSSRAVENLTQISSSPVALYAEFKDRNQLMNVANDLPIPIQVFFLLHSPLFLHFLLSLQCRPEAQT